MNALAERYRDLAGSVFLYTHEAHPGEHYPHHDSFARKLEHARALRDQLGVTRPILVDALDGACHRAFGTMPNMTWILTRAGVPVYKSDWTDAASVANTLEYLSETRRRRAQGVRLANFRVERLDSRVSDPSGFRAGLLRSGPKALAEYERFQREGVS